MSYYVIWDPKVRRHLKKLPGDVSSRIVKRVKEMKDDPFHYLEHYEGEDFYKLRIGDYRALIDVDFSSKVLRVRVVGHRRNIYKGL